MPDLVRIRDKSTNTEYTVGRRRAEQLAERSKDVEITDAAATDDIGRALPPAETTKTKSASSRQESAR